MIELLHHIGNVILFCVFFGIASGSDLQRQGIAIIKDIPLDLLHTCRNGQMFQAAAFPKGKAFNFRYTIWDLHILKAGAIAENTVSDLGHIVREGNAAQAQAVSEYPCAKLCYAVGNNDAL